MWQEWRNMSMRLKTLLQLTCSALIIQHLFPSNVLSPAGREHTAALNSVWQVISGTHIDGCPATKVVAPMLTSRLVKQPGDWGRADARGRWSRPVQSFLGRTENRRGKKARCGKGKEMVEKAIEQEAQLKGEGWGVPWRSSSVKEDKALLPLGYTGMSRGSLFTSLSHTQTHTGGRGGGLCGHQGPSSR